jgi:hypothetical protein
MSFRILLACLCVATAALHPQTAEASTTPSIDLERGRTRVAVGGLPLPGAFTLTADHDILENLSVGAVYCPWTYTGGRLVGPLIRSTESPSKLGWSIEGGLRGTASLADWYGFPLASGTWSPPMLNAETSGPFFLLRNPDYGTVFHPSIVFSFEGRGFTTRCAVGPAWVMNVTNQNGGLIYDHFFHLVFNPEIAWRITPGGELTLSGQGGLGWRQAF